MTKKMPLSQQEIFDKIVPIVANQLNLLPEDVTMDASLTYDLALDSLGSVEVIMEFEKTFNLSIPYDEQQENIQTVGDIVKITEKSMQKIAKKDVYDPLWNWSR